MAELLLTRSGSAVVLLAVVALVPAARASAANRITGAELRKLVKAGPVSLTGTRVDGDVTLDRVLSYPFTCRDCRFDGDVVASGATFRKLVDLSGSDFAGKVDLSGAKFKSHLLASGADFLGLVDLRNAQISGRTDLSEASFLAPALLGNAQFGEAADLSLTSFAGLASFGSTNFAKSADFSFARFEQASVFTAGSAGDPAKPTQVEIAKFERATFGGRTDFDSFQFHGITSFAGAEFAGPVNFSQANFESSTYFSDARLGKGGTFVAATFGRNPDTEVQFDGVQSDGDLSFAAATFNGPTDFEYAVVKGALSFDQAELPGAASMHVLDVTAGSFEMNADTALAKVQSGDRPAALGLIESSAKARGDLALANQAHYAHQVLNSERLSLPLRMLDLVFYRAIAGYFVRPLHPLLALLALAALFTAVRARSLVAAARTGSTRGARAVGLRTFETAGDFGKAFLSTLALIPPGGGKAAERQTRQVEVWTYRILFACVVIGFANANPALSQMLHALG